jgi:HlyD family secretion protein
MKRLRFWIVILVLLGLGAGGVRLWLTRRVQAKADLPSAAARKGEFQVKVRCRGDMMAARSVQLTAPMNVPGMQIAWQAPPNSEVKEGEAVVRFDSSILRQTLLENKAALGSAQATLDQYIAQAKITAEQDQLDLASARVEVEKARLEASKQEVVGRIQGEESKIDFGLAEEKLKVQEAAINLHDSSSAQKINSGKRLRDKAQADIDLANHRLELMEMKAPSNGVVVYLPNYSQGWVNAKPFKVGDQVWPGSVIAELPDLSTLEMKAKLEETDRGRVSIGQEARVTVDPFPEKPFPSKVESLSPLVVQGFEWPPTRNFTVQIRLNQPDPRLRPAMNAQVDIVVDTIPDAISVPSGAVFTHRGRPTVYVGTKSGWEAKEVEILARNADEVAIRGVEPSAQVALTEPELAGLGDAKAGAKK